MGKRKMNWPETRRRYQERIRMLPDDLWRNLDGAYLGTFEIYSTVEAMDEDEHMDCFAGVVFRVAVEKGTSLGITSVRKSRACTYARPCWTASHGQRPPSCTLANTRTSPTTRRARSRRCPPTTCTRKNHAHRNIFLPHNQTCNILCLEKREPSMHGGGGKRKRDGDSKCPVRSGALGTRPITCPNDHLFSRDCNGRSYNAGNTQMCPVCYAKFSNLQRMCERATM